MHWVIVLSTVGDIIMYMEVFSTVEVTLSTMGDIQLIISVYLMSISGTLPEINRNSRHSASIRKNR